MKLTDAVDSDRLVRTIDLGAGGHPSMLLAALACFDALEPMIEVMGR